MRMRFALAAMVLLMAAAYADSTLSYEAQLNITPQNIAAALVFNLVIELITSYIYLSVRKLPKKILLSVVVANTISVPIMFFLSPVVLSWNYHTVYYMYFGKGVNVDILDVILWLELGIVILEAVIIFLMNRKNIKIYDAIAMSFINNVVSFLGGYVYLFISTMLR